MKFILSIDGGGIRGLVPAIVLAELEKRLNKPVAKMFDLLCGTSTGGILALGLVKDKGDGEPQYAATDLAKIYQERGRDIFQRSFWKGMSSVGSLADEKYSAKGLEKVLEEFFANEPMGSALRNVMVTTYDIQNREPLFLKSWHDKYKSLEMRFAGRATSAAPTYFEPALTPVGGSVKALIDGGVFINNPSVSAYVEALRLYPGEEILLLSIGTGELVRPIAYNEAKDWGKAGWMLPVLDCMFDGVSDAADYQLKQLLGDNYIRLQTDLSLASDDMDNASAGNIALLAQEAKKLLATNKQKINRLTDLLAGG